MAEEDWVPEGFDLDETLRAIGSADVLVVGFGWLAERLLIDARTNESIGPYIRVVDPVRTPQERLRQLRRIRPGLADPESYVFFPWAGRVDTFINTGLFDHILARFSGDDRTTTDAQKALAKLEALDREDLRQAIAGGEKYHTLYDRSERPDD